MKLTFLGHNFRSWTVFPTSWQTRHSRVGQYNECEKCPVRKYVTDTTFCNEITKLKNIQLVRVKLSYHHSFYDYVRKLILNLNSQRIINHDQGGSDIKVWTVELIFCM